MIRIAMRGDKVAYLAKHGLKPELQKSQLKKKRWTHHRFLHRGPKKAVEQEYDVHFDQTWAKKIRNGF